MIYLLNNVVQPYSWGSQTMLTELLGVSNPKQLPQAELWMGAHRNGCSTVITRQGAIRLDELIAANPYVALGKAVYEKFGELPFLLKVLAVDSPLSIQVHPTKSSAVEGFLRENNAGIPLSAANRSYKDKNHKPELIFALTEFIGMNGFRHANEIIRLFEQANIAVLTEALVAFKRQPTEQGLARFFEAIFQLRDERLNQATKELLEHKTQHGCCPQVDEAFELAKCCAVDYPNDVGIFAPLLLNIVVLQPGEAMFLPAGTPHAYVYGCGVEVMANSDNVLRAGLTQKHTDLDALLMNIHYQAAAVETIKAAFSGDEEDKHFFVPVDDFALQYFKISGVKQLNNVGAEILLCLSGEVEIASSGQGVTMFKGSSVFISADSKSYQLMGCGIIVRAFCPVASNN